MEEGSGERSVLTENERESSHLFLKWLVVIGTMVVNLPNSLPAFYGNLSAYTDSYFHFFIGAGENQTVWMFPIFMSCTVFGFLTVDWIVGKVGLCATQITAAALIDLGILLTYFTVQYSVGLVMLTLMISGGYFVGNVFMINLIYAAKMVPHRSGIASAVTTGGFGLGGLFLNFLITNYINPLNLAPDFRGTDRAYFSQVEILDMVPRSFLVIGVTDLVLHSLGLLLIHIPLKFIKFHDTASNSKSANKKQNAKSSNSSDPISTEEGNHRSSHRENLNAESVGSSDIILDTTTDSYTGSERSFFPVQNGRSDLKPLEVLQTRSFYVAWITACVLSVGYILSLTYYKHFGQLWIKDDVFLTATGSFAAVSVVLCRIVFGAIIDQVGIKRSTALLLSLNSITMSFWYFTAIPSRWLYFAWVQVICGTTGCLFLLAAMIILKFYGETYYATNYGLVMTASLVTGLVTPLLIPAILDNTGWSGLMAIESGFSFVALTFVLLILPEAQ